jgi:hypothetical protein
MLKSTINVGLFLLSSSSFSAHAVDDYLLTLKVERGDVTAIDTVVEVESGRSADLQLRTNADRKNSASEVHTEADTGASKRIIASVKKAGDAEADVQVDIQYFEKNDENWILIGQPTIVAALGAEASIESAPTDFAPLKISVRVEKSVDSGASK